MDVTEQLLGAARTASKNLFATLVALIALSAYVCQRALSVTIEPTLAHAPVTQGNWQSLEFSFAFLTATWPLALAGLSLLAQVLALRERSAMTRLGKHLDHDVDLAHDLNAHHLASAAQASTSHRLALGIAGVPLVAVLVHASALAWVLADPQISLTVSDAWIASLGMTTGLVACLAIAWSLHRLVGRGAGWVLAVSAATLLAFVTAWLVTPASEAERSAGDNGFALGGVPDLEFGEALESLATTQTRFTVGTLGQVHEARQALTAALAGHQARRGRGTAVDLGALRSPPRREVLGIRVSTGRVDYETETRQYVHFDAPSHEDVIKSLITGAMTLDVAIVVVAGQGAQAETREQVRLAAACGVREFILFQDVTNLSDDDDARESETDFRVWLAHHTEDTRIPVIRGSASELHALITENGLEVPRPTSIDDVLAALDDVPAAPRSTPRATARHEISALIMLRSGPYPPILLGHTYVFAFANKGQRRGRAEQLMLLGESQPAAGPGDHAELMIMLEAPVSVAAGQHFEIRHDDQVLGAGVVTGDP